MNENWIDSSIFATPHTTMTLVHRLQTLESRYAWACVLLVCVGLLGFGLYLQHVQGLEPCPMCIVQRYAMTAMAVLALVGTRVNRLGLARGLMGVAIAVAGFGAFVAARQTWLQWYPPNTVSCGRDFYGMIEAFPLQRAIPLIFRGSGDCTKIDWTFLGGSIANWSFVAFVAMALWLVWMLFRSWMPSESTKNPFTDIAD